MSISFWSIVKSLHNSINSSLIKALRCLEDIKSGNAVDCESKKVPLSKERIGQDGNKGVEVKSVKSIQKLPQECSNVKHQQ